MECYQAPGGAWYKSWMELVNGGDDLEPDTYRPKAATDDVPYQAGGGRRPSVPQ